LQKQELLKKEAGKASQRYFAFQEKMDKIMLNSENYNVFVSNFTKTKNMCYYFKDTLSLHLFYHEMATHKLILVILTK
jgi:hypothetical protein